MSKLSLLLFAAAQLALAESGAPGPALIMRGSGSVATGVTIRFATYAIPGGKGAAGYGEGGVADSPTSIQRYMKDPATGVYFGYALEIAGNETSGYSAVFHPLAPEAARISIDGQRLRTVSPKLPPPQPVRDGDTIVLDIMASPDGSQKLVDYLQVFLKPREPAAATNHAEPRDFTVDDGAISYDASAMTVWIDGRKQPCAAFTGKPGATFWLAVPGRGRYILSLVAHAGLAMDGVIRDNTIMFTDEAQQYEIRFMRPIAGAGKAWNLYVLRDPAYQPVRRPEAISCGVDRLGGLMAGR